MAIGATVILEKSAKADGALTKFRAVKAGSSQDHVAASTAATDVVIGIVQEEVTADDATKGRVVNIRILGVSHAIAGAALSPYTRVTVDATGRMVAAAAGNTQVGIWTTNATAANDRGTVLLTPGVKA